MNTEEPKTVQLLNECQSLMGDRLSQSLSQMMDKADDVLFDLAQRGGPREHPFYFNAMREVRLKRSSIETAFRDHFTEMFDKSLQNRKLDAGKTDVQDETDIEEMLAITNTSGKVRHACHEALLSLDQRMGSLMDEIHIDKRQNPVYPEKVCTAFQEACRDIESGIEIKLILFKLFEKYVASGLQDIYTDIETLLTENNLGQQVDTRAENGRRQMTGSQQAFTSGNNIIKDKNYYIIANRVIRNAINDHLGSGEIPKFVRDFLFTHWSKLMMKIHIRDGTNTRAWHHAVEVIDDLVNLVGSESSLTEKRNLTGMMQNLVQRLKFGMNVIPVTPTVREEFISELVQYHKSLVSRPVKAPARNESETTGEQAAGTEDITVPRFKTRSTSSVPFMDELLVDNKRKT